MLFLRTYIHFCIHPAMGKRSIGHLALALAALAWASSHLLQALPTHFPPHPVTSYRLLKPITCNISDFESVLSLCCHFSTSSPPPTELWTPGHLRSKWFSSLFFFVYVLWCFPVFVTCVVSVLFLLSSCNFLFLVSGVTFCFLLTLQHLCLSYFTLPTCVLFPPFFNACPPWLASPVKHSFLLCIYFCVFLSLFACLLLLPSNFLCFIYSAH